MKKIYSLTEIREVECLLFASPGGHMDQLIALTEKLNNSYLIVTDGDISDEPSSLAEYYQLKTSRRYLLWRNFTTCYRLILKAKPKVVISTGAGSAVILFLISKILGIATIYIESKARITSLSLTGFLIQYISDNYFVQSKSLANQRRIYKGKIHL